MLTIAPLKRWSVRYYNDTSRAATAAAMDRQSAGGGLGEYYAESETRGAVWICAGDTYKVAELVGLSDEQRAGGAADLDVVARWLDDGIAPNEASGNAFGPRANHGFDLTFCAPKSVSVARGVDVTGVIEKAFSLAHNDGIAAALTYAAEHVAYTRVHNPVTGKKDLVRLPGLVAAAYQHETSRAGDPHLHTHVLLFNKQPRADGKLVAIDSDSLWHEAKAMGVVYQVTVRRRIFELLSLEWGPIAAHSAMAELAGVDPELLAAASQRSTQLGQWAAENLVIVGEDGPSAAQLARAQKATRPRKPEHRPWVELKAEWRQRFGELVLDPAAQAAAREQRIAAAGVKARDLLGAAVAGMDKPAFTRADLIEALGGQMPVTLDGADAEPLELLERMADVAAMRITEPRAPHEREGHERYTAAPIIAEEIALFELLGGRREAAAVPAEAVDTAGLSADQAAAVEAIAVSPQLVQVLSAPAGAGKTTSLRALRTAAHRGGMARVIAVAPTGRAVDVALAEGAADHGGTVAKALADLCGGQLRLSAQTLLIVDEAGMVGTAALRELLTAAADAGTKTVLVGDPRQLSPVRARGGMFAQLCADLPWAQHLSEVWRMRDPAERIASLAVRDGDPAALAEAATWYRDHERLSTGDPVTMADDALRAWTAERAEGFDSLLIADRWEIADALNERIHRQTVAADAPTVAGARRHRIGQGDVVITRRNDLTVAVVNGRDNTPVTDAPVRNGQRWYVQAVDPTGKSCTARRIEDGAIAVFDGDYLRNHVHHGYAVTVHAAQGATAERCHAVLSVTGQRRSAYVAMTRGRHINKVYLYERIAGEGDHEHGLTAQPGVHEARRGEPAEATANLLRLLGRDDSPHTVVETATAVAREHLPGTVSKLLDFREQALASARVAHQKAQLIAEVDWLDLAGRAMSHASTYHSDETAELLANTPGLKDGSRATVANLAEDDHTVQSLHLRDDTTKAALLAALIGQAEAAGRQVTTICGTDHARRESADYLVHTRRALTAEAGLQALHDHGPTWRNANDPLIGSLLVVDDADHLAPEQLHQLVRYATGCNFKLLLVTAENRHPNLKAPSRHLTVAAATHLPWAQHPDGLPTIDTALHRAQNLDPRSIADHEIHETIDRATELINRYTAMTTPAREARHDRSTRQERERSRSDDGYDYSL